ncbi:MAG: hypothetical protein E7666_03760 [Ruminococcaceae bacterium]|nr:hypothetical protein [Oscillospiraceae bacterium]
MGKGSRNRQLHFQDKLENPQKYKEKKKAPKWLGSAIALTLAIVILVGIVASAVIDSGIIKRNRVIFESQTGKFDVTQPMATYLAWQEQYSTWYYYWYYCSYYGQKDETGLVSTFSYPDAFAQALAKLSIQETLRDCVDDVLDTLKIYIAVCDEADRKGIKLDSEDQAEIDKTITELKSMQQNFGYTSFKAFLKDNMGNGMKESDIRKALEMVTLYTKYTSIMQVEYEKVVTPGDLATFRDENPDDYYKVDYLTFAADNEDLAKELIACTTAEEFKALVLNNHLNKNYKTAFNKFTTLVETNEVLASIKDLTDTDTSKKLTEKLDELGADAVKEIKAEDALVKNNKELSSWLLNKSRKQYEKNVFVVENGVYLIVIMSEEGSTEKASVRLKFYEYVEGTTFEGDENFKENILKYITESKKDTPSYPTVTYKKAADKANALKTELEAKDAKIAEILKANNASEQKDVTSSSTSTSKLPKAVITAATASSVKAGKVLIANDGNTYYTIYVSDVTDKKYDISFVTFVGDTYYQIIDDLTASLNKVYPTEQTKNYVSEPEKDSFEAWMSETVKDQGMTSARKEFDTKYFKVTKDKVDTYNAYIILNTPLYLDTEVVVKGGYLKFSKDDFAKLANDALNTIKDKTDLDLLNALSALDSTNAKVSTAIKEDTVKTLDEELHKWLFSADRKANDSAVITAKDGKSAYVAVFSEKAELWASTAKTNYVTEQLKEWADGLAEKYTASESVLNKLGQPTPEETTSGTGTGSSEESSSKENDIDG